MTTTLLHAFGHTRKTPTKHGFLRHSAATLLSLAVLAAPVAHAAGTVGTGTAASCTDGALNTALTGGGVVTFNCGAAPATITVLTTKAIAVSTSIDGGNLITLSGGDARQVLAVSAGVYLGLLNLTIAHGNAGFGSGQAMSVAAGATLQATNVNFNANGSVGGGGIALFSMGTTVIQNSTFSSNNEGAIGVSGGTMSVTNSTFADNHNSPGFFDGAAIVVIGGTLTVNGSTFANNSAGGGFGGGALYNQGTTTIINSTFTGNSHSVHQGGAVASQGAGANITLLNVTLSGNSAAGGGGGLAVNSGNAQSNNSIIANNTPSDCGGSLTSASSYNLTGDASCAFAGGVGNLINTNPRLAALAGNGGPTQTMALIAGSPAIDAGSPTPVGGDACSAVDQRNAARPQGPRCDIGAFEVAGSNCTLDVDGNNSIDALTDGLIVMRAMFGLTGTAVTSDAVGGGATRGTWALIQPYLNGNCGTSFLP